MASWAMRSPSGRDFVNSFTTSRSNYYSNSRRTQTASPVAPLTRRKRNARMADSATASVTRPPPSPPRDPPSCADIDALEEALIVSIRTAGLKPGRENQLAEEALRLRRRRKNWLDCTENLLREWAGHASLLWELHEQELSNMGHTRRQRDKEHAARLALLTKQLEEERERNSTVVAQEREDGEARVRAAQEGHELWKKAHQDEIAATGEREIARTAARLRRDAEQHARSIEESLEAEYFDRHSATIAERDKHAAEAAASQNKSSRLEADVRRLEAQVAEAAERTRRIERLSLAQKDAAKEMKLAMERQVKRLSKKLEEEHATAATDRSANSEAIREVRSQWKEELRTVDERVREVVGTKDQVVQQLNEELETATHRAQMAEALLEELQRRICPAAMSSSPSRNEGQRALFSPRRS